MLQRLITELELRRARRPRGQPMSWGPSAFMPVGIHETQ